MGTLRILRAGTPEAIDGLCRALTHTFSARDGAGETGAEEEHRDVEWPGNFVHSPLIRHEIAFVLGQLRDPLACHALEQVRVVPI